MKQVAMILDHPLLTRKLFFPEENHVPPTLVVESSGHRLGCFRYHRFDDAGYLLHFHGNGETAAEHAEHFSKLFLETGINVCFAEYRGYGMSSGSPALGAMLPDGEQIARRLGEPCRIVAYGRSLGAVYAVELARRLPELAGLILESADSDVGGWLAARLQRRNGGPAALGCSEEEFWAELREHLDFQKVLGAFRGEVLVLHAEPDSLVPSWHAQRLWSWADGARRRLILWKEGDHDSLVRANRSAFVAEVRTFIRRAGVSGAGRPPG